MRFPGLLVWFVRTNDLHRDFPCPLINFVAGLSFKLASYGLKGLAYGAVRFEARGVH